jgi:hypothetical protein
MLLLEKREKADFSAFWCRFALTFSRGAINVRRLYSREECVSLVWILWIHRNMHREGCVETTGRVTTSLSCCGLREATFVECLEIGGEPFTKDKAYTPSRSYRAFFCWNTSRSSLVFDRDGNTLQHEKPVFCSMEAACGRSFAWREEAFGNVSHGRCGIRLIWYG